MTMTTGDLAFDLAFDLALVLGAATKAGISPPHVMVDVSTSCIYSTFRGRRGNGDPTSPSGRGATLHHRVMFEYHRNLRQHHFVASARKLGSMKRASGGG